MTYREEIADLFLVPEEYYLAHCISADFGMGKGIVVEFNRRFNMKRVLLSKYPDYLARYRNIKDGGDCIMEGRVFNLITKERYYNKPTLATMRAALESMKDTCQGNDIKKIAMPVIGCGLDRLSWKDVSGILKQTFYDTDIEILVCMQKNKADMHI